MAAPFTVCLRFPQGSNRLRKPGRRRGNRVSDKSFRILDAMSRTFALWVLAAFFVVAGANHFLNPGPYLAMMPHYLPWHEGLIIVSGVAEIAGGLAILVARVRRLAGWGLIALLVAVFPANVQVAQIGR